VGKRGKRYRLRLSNPVQPRQTGGELNIMIFSRNRLGRWIVLFAIVVIHRAHAEPTTEVLITPPRNTFLILPLHVHVLSCPNQEDLDCKLTDEDVRRIIAKVNDVWHKAGVHFRLEPILHETAEHVKEFAENAPAQAGKSSLNEYRQLAPAESGSLPGLHVYYIHQFSVNGVFLGDRMCFVKETATLRPVDGGIDEPIPRVTSHELGHALGLPHRQDVKNLMASGNNGTKLNVAEVEIARTKARKIEGVLTVDECEAKAKDDDSLRKDLEQLPK
jgi:hypothetical protein